MRRTTNSVKNLLVIALLAATAFTALAQDGSAGQAGEILRSGLDARSFSMGRAYTVMPSGGDALVWNPAGLGKLGRWELRLMHAQGYFDSRTEFGSFAIPIGNLGGFALGFANEGVSKIDGRDQFNRPTDELSWGESVAMFGWGRPLMSYNFYGGLSAKYVMMNMGDLSANGFGGVDLGLMTKELRRRYSFGIAVQNLGATEVAGDAYPITIRAGVGLKVLRDLYVTVDGEMVSGRDISPRIGAEYVIKNWLAIRAGFDVMRPELTFGLGFTLDEITGRIAGTYPTIDYAGGALGPIGNNFGRVSLVLQGEFIDQFEDIENPCDELSRLERLMPRRGFEGARANLIYGECGFIDEAINAPLRAEPRLGDLYQFFHEAYDGKYGAGWVTEVVTDSLAKTIFSQKTHYMYAETRMARGIDEEAKALVEQLISAGGDSAQYDVRLRYNLALINERLGDVDEALRDYESIADQNITDPVRVLALYRAANILKDRDKNKAVNYLETLISRFGTGFWDEDGERLSYPMFPKYRDNSVVDDATVLLADIVFSMASGDKAMLRRALGLYLDVLILYPDMDASVRKEAAQKAAICYEELGDNASAANMRSRAEEI